MEKLPQEEKAQEREENNWWTNIQEYPPIAPRRTASAFCAAERVSSGNGTPVKSKAAPPMGISRKLNSIPNTCQNICRNKESPLYEI